MRFNVGIGYPGKGFAEGPACHNEVPSRGAPAEEQGHSWAAGMQRVGVATGAQGREKYEVP